MSFIFIHIYCYLTLQFSCQHLDTCKQGFMLGLTQRLREAKFKYYIPCTQFRIENLINDSVQDIYPLIPSHSTKICNVS